MIQVGDTVNLSIQYEYEYDKRYPGFANYARELGPDNWEVRRVYRNGRARLRKNGLTLDAVPRWMIIADGQR